MRAAARARAEDARQAPRELVALLAVGLLAAAYFVIRPGGLWAETDSGLMAQAIRVVINRAELAPASPDAYYNGYGYQAVAMAIVMYTGVSVQTLQQEIFPFISALLVLPAWALYRELTGNGRIATLAVLILLLVPEHEFAVLRASHERLDRAFLMTALWLLLRAARARDDRTSAGVHLALVLVMAWGLIATNALFGMSLVAALLSAMALSWVAARVVPSVRVDASATIRLLRWPTLGASLLLLAFVLFVYPPIQPTLRELGSIPARLIDLILNGGGGFDPYAAILAAWVSPLAYVLLSLVDFVLIAGSVAVWVGLGWRWLRGHAPASLGSWMLWIFFAAFSIQGAVSIVSDRTGSLAANVQYRAFAVFAVIAAPMVATALGGIRLPHGLLRAAVAGITAMAVAGAAAAALVKSTLDPGVSNKWIFYTQPEIEGAIWMSTNLPGRRTWIGPDDRLLAAYEMVVGGLSHSDVWDLGTIDAGTSYLLVSGVVVEQSKRLGSAMPDLAATGVIYDNGAVQVRREDPFVPAPVVPGPN